MLIIALGVLALLSILAVTFVSLMKLELLASKNYVDGVKARLIAEGGMEEAVTELKTRGGMTGVTNINDSWVYAAGHYWLPIEQSTTLHQPANVNDYANRASFVGNLGGSYASKGDRYKIEVIDAQAQFNINNVFDAQSLDPANRENNVYTRTLRCLGEAIKELNPNAQLVDPIARAAYPRNAPKYFGADAFLAYRLTLEGKQYESKYQLMEILASEQDYQVLFPYITTKSWMDPKATVARNHDIGTVQRGSFYATEPFTDCWTITPNPGDLPNQRAPININLAPVEVLAANLCGLGGRAVFYYYGDRTKTNILEVVDNTTKFAFTAHSDIQEELVYAVTPVNVYFGQMGYKPVAAGATGGPSTQGPDIKGALAIAQMIDARRRSGPASTGTTSGPQPAGQGPFKSYADWERWVDQNLNDNFFSAGSYASFFPQPSTCRILNIDDTALVGTPADTDIRNNPRFKQWFFDCLRSVIKANFNPNGRLSMMNPNAAAYMEVDKGNLLYFMNSAQPTFTKYNTQTCEWCFGSKGVFELISLGEVLGAHPTIAGTLDEKNPIAQAKILTDVQLFDQVSHTSQRDFERSGDPVSFQRPMSASGTGGGYGGFGDEKRQLPPGNGLRYGIVSYPYPKQFWDPRVGGWPLKPVPTDQDRNLALMTGGPDLGLHAHENEGHLELSPRLTIAGSRPNDTSVTNFGTLLFELLFQDRHVRTPGTLATQIPADSYEADVANKIPQNTNPGFGYPSEGEPTTAFAFAQPTRLPGAIPIPQGTALPAAAYGVYGGSVTGSSVMFSYLMEPDGFYSNALRNLPLFYRASDNGSVGGKGGGAGGGNQWPPIFDLQGDSNPTGTGNCWATPTGGCEFWYKPDFDWYVRQKTFGAANTDPTIGYLPGPNGGDLPDERFCGLMVTCHNVINQAATNWQQPDGKPRATRGITLHVMRDTSGDLRVTRIYFEVCGEAGFDLPWVSDIQPGSGGPAPNKPIRLGRVGVANPPTYMNNASTRPEYTWPPLEFQVIPAPWHDIKWARVDTWVPANAPVLKQWRAHEWHHIGVRWADQANIGPSRTDSIEIYLDSVLMPTISRQIGPHYNAVTNTPQQPVAPPQPPATTLPANLPSTDQPAFCRLNEDPTGDPSQGYADKTRWPKDHIQIGGIERHQAVQGGLYKFTPTGSVTDLPANGTVDGVRFYDGITPPSSAGSLPDRYEEYGVWTNDIDLSSCFVPGQNFLDLGNLQFTAYLPTYYGAAKTQGARGGAGSVVVSFQIIHPDKSVTTYAPTAGNPGWSCEFNDNSASLGGFSLTDPTGRSAVVSPQDRLVYTVNMYPARLQGGAGGTLGGDSGDRGGIAVATPVLDDVTLVYFLPTPRILLKERLWD
jgi:type II secretory pathway component PulK